MKALVIAPQPFFASRGTPFSVYYRALITAEQGVEVDLLTYGEGQDVDIPGVRIIRIPRVPFLSPVPIGPSGKKFFLDGLMVLWTLRLLAANRYDFVQAHEESVFFSRLLKPLFGFKLLYDMHSSLPQQLTNFNFTRSRRLIGLFEKLENGALTSADAVITICPDLAEYAVPRMVDPDRHFLIENSIFESVRLKGPARDNGVVRTVPALPEGRPLVAYAGTFEVYQGLDILLPAFARVHAARPDAFLLMVGGAPKQVAHYRALAASLGLADHSLFTGRLEHAQAQSLMRQAAVLMSPRSEGTNTPLKIYEQLASGRPLVATRIRSHTQVLNDDVCFLVDPNPQAMAAGILEALDPRGRREQVTAAARAFYDANYSRRIYEEKVRAVLRTLSPAEAEEGQPRLARSR